MTATVTIKKGRIAQRKDPLTDPAKLRTIGRSASLKAQKRAFENGAAVTVVKDGAVVRVGPNGTKEEVKKIQAPFPRLEEDLCLG